MRAARLVSFIVAVASIGLTPSAAMANPGVVEWSVTIGAGTEDRTIVNDIATDPTGTRVFATGTSRSPGDDPVALTVARDAATGAELWTSRFDGPVTGFDAGSAIASDATTVFVTGQSRGAGTGRDILTIAYDAATGEQLWVHRLDVGGVEVGHDIEVAGANVVVGANGGEQGRLIVLDAATGERRWTRVVGRDGFGSGDVEVDGGRVFAVTNRFFSYPVSAEYHVRAFDLTTGSQIWSDTYRGPAGVDALATAGATSPNGKTLYVTGTANDFSDEPIATIAYDASTGERRWVRLIRRPRATEWDRPLLEAVPTGSGVVVATDVFDNATGAESVFVASLANRAGGVRWRTHRLETPERGSVYALAVGQNGIYVAGQDGGEDPPVPITLAFPVDGPPVAWRASIEPEGTGDYSAYVAVDPDGTTVFVASYVGDRSRLDAYAAT